MRNLKKILSLALALVMVFSLVTFANAAGTTDFNDDAEIDHPTAVNTLVSLNVIDGVGNNNFNPAGSVKRGELCKIIAVILNGGQEPVLDEGGSSFSDTANHWARAYVEYCVAQNIVDGYGDGTFKPEQAVTGSEAAKMLLVAMGYNPDVFGLTGARWAVNVAVEANKAGLYKDILGTNPANALNRDATAQMTFNAIFAGTMGISYQFDPVDGKVTNTYNLNTNATLFSTKFNGNNENSGVLTGITYNDVKNTYTYTVGGTSYTMAADYSDFYGQTVTVLVNTKKQNDDLDYGMFVKEGSVMAEDYATEVNLDKLVSDKEVKVGGTAYKADTNSLTYYEFNNGAGTFNKNALAWTRLIDQDGDNCADALVITPLTFDKVTYVGRDNITLKTGGNKKLADITTYSGIAKDDYVVVTAAANTVYNKDEYVKAEPETSEVTSYRNPSGTDNFRVNGSWKKLMGDASGKLNSTDVGSTIEYYSFGGVIYELKVISGQGLDNIALVVDATESKTTSNAYSWTVSLLLADGTKASVTPVDRNGDNINPTNTQKAGETAHDIVGKLVSFEINNKGDYVLTALSTSNKVGFENVATSSVTLKDADGNAVNAVKSVNDGTTSYEVADDAVVFWIDTTQKDAKIFTGKELKSLSSATYTSTAQAFATSKANGFETAKVVLISHTSRPSSFTVGNTYGYLTAHAYTQKDENGKSWVYYTIWTADGEVQAREEGTSISGKTSGTVVRYDSVSADGVVRNLHPLTPASEYQVGTVDGWDGTKKISLKGTLDLVTNVVSDTQIIYVNSADKKGVEGGSINEGADSDSDEKPDVPNVFYIKAVGDELALLIVDVNNEIKVVGTMSLGSSPTASQIAAALQSGKAETNTTSLPNTTVPAGSSLKLTGAVANKPELKGEGTVELDSSGSLAYDNLTEVATKVGAGNTTGSAGQEVDLPDTGVEFKGAGKITGFSSKTMDQLAGNSGSTTVTIHNFVVPNVAAGDKVKAERIGGSNTSWTLIEGVLGASGGYEVQSGDLTGSNLEIVMAVGNRTTQYRITVTHSGTDTVYYFNNN